jgi:hypothetical protein
MQKPASYRGRGRPTAKGRRRALALATRRARILPSFLVIGAQRAGTTSFFSNLCRHPQVGRPAGKELHFFNYDYWRGVTWYRAFFPTVAARQLARLRGSDLVTGEATPYYLFHPAGPARVAETLPDVKLIVLLRNPVDRAYSHYQKMCRMGVERLSFENALAAEERRLAGEQERLASDPDYRSDHHRRHAYIARGLYADQLERWFAIFPRDRFLVLLAEDYFARPAETYAETLDFLGLQQRELADRRAGSPPAYAPIDPQLRASLEERFSEPNARLARLLGRELWAPTAQSAPAPPSPHDAQSSSPSSSAYARS